MDRARGGTVYQTEVVRGGTTQSDMTATQPATTPRQRATMKRSSLFLGIALLLFFISALLAY